MRYAGAAEISPFAVDVDSTTTVTLKEVEDADKTDGGEIDFKNSRRSMLSSQKAPVPNMYKIHKRFL